MSSEIRWNRVCPADALVANRGVAALVEGVQVAIFRVEPGGGLYALANHDPFSRANVLSRGIVGSRGDRLKVASPVFKQSFDLVSGQCLDDPEVCLATYPIRLVDGWVEIGGRSEPMNPAPISASQSQPVTSVGVEVGL
ncbi:MAG: nitrite reductase small subunit NirD [Acidimicrobiales bacterium]